MIKVSVKDFGPIARGEVELKPLTIFVGPSNAGKSYMATMVYSLMQTLDELTAPSYFSYTSQQVGITRSARSRKLVRNLEYLVEVNRTVTNVVHEWARSVSPQGRESAEISLVELPDEVRGLVSEAVNSAIESALPFFCFLIGNYRDATETLLILGAVGQGLLNYKSYSIKLSLN